MSGDPFLPMAETRLQGLKIFEIQSRHLCSRAGGVELVGQGTADIAELQVEILLARQEHRAERGCRRLKICPTSSNGSPACRCCRSPTCGLFAAGRELGQRPASTSSPG